MKITAIMGSPRKNGVTSRITRGFLEHAEARGADIQAYYLNQMEFTGCQGCHSCKGGLDACVLRDDLTPALEDLVESDILVLASPIYFWDVTGQFKCFFDRTWSLVKPDYTTNSQPVRMAPGKKAVWISSQGDKEEKFREVIDKYIGFMAMFGCETRSIRAFDMGDGPDQEIGPFLRQAKDMAEQLIP